MVGVRFARIALGLAVVIVIFSAIYFTLPGHAFYVVNRPDSNGSITYTEALMTSVSTQTLLGQGDVVAVSGASRALSMVQSLGSFLLLLYLASTKGEKS